MHHSKIQNRLDWISKSISELASPAWLGPAFLRWSLSLLQEPPRRTCWKSKCVLCAMSRMGKQVQVMTWWSRRWQAVFRFWKQSILIVPLEEYSSVTSRNSPSLRHNSAYIYIYRERERERESFDTYMFKERKRKRERERERVGILE